MQTIQAMAAIVAKATKSPADLKSYNIKLFDMGLAIAGELAGCFFASLTAFSVGIPDDTSDHWENWTFGGGIVTRRQAGADAGTRCIARNGTIQEIEVPDLAKCRLPQLVQVAPRHTMLLIRLSSVPASLEASRQPN
jgi:hypothetical protein